MSPTLHRRHALALSVAVSAALMLHSLVLYRVIEPAQPLGLAPAPQLSVTPLHVRQLVGGPRAWVPDDASAPAADKADKADKATKADNQAAPPIKSTPTSAKRLAEESLPQARGAQAAREAPKAQGNEVAREDREDRDAQEAKEAQEPLATPTYATLPAPAVTLTFQSKRGQLQGLTRLHWQAGNEQYRLQLQFEGLGGSRAGWSSAGRFDAHGLAPDRYSEFRRAREVRATNFQRDTQTLSFSAQSPVLPLPVGLQDRSSWILQLGAVLQANPGLAAPGDQITLPVVGTRGRPEAWTFTVMRRGAHDTPSGPVADAVQLLREPRRPYDTRVTVWLDAARHYLPVELHWAVHGSGEGQQWRLAHLQWE